MLRLLNSSLIITSVFTVCMFLHFKVTYKTVHCHLQANSGKSCPLVYVKIQTYSIQDIFKCKSKRIQTSAECGSEIYSRKCK